MKKILISIISFMFILSIMVSSVYAASGSISAGSSSDTVVKGKTFTVTLAATADTPIDGMYTKFTYDKNVLSLESSAAGENYGNNSSEGEILVVSNAETSPTSATLYTITFKVLDTASVDSTTISFSESALHLNENGTMNESTTTIDNVVINIKADDTTVDNQGNQDNQDNTQTEEPENTTETPSNTNDSDNDNGSNTSNNANTNKNTNTNKNVNKNTNKNTTKLPQTGIESTSVIVLVALVVVSIASFVSYRKYKNI